MEGLLNVIQPICTRVGDWLCCFLGGYDGPLCALFAIVVIHYITDVMCAISDHRSFTEVGFKGICRKVSIFLLVVVFNILDMTVIDSGRALRKIVIFYYIYHEGVELLKNARRLGLPIPDKVESVLEQLRGVSDKE